MDKEQLLRLERAGVDLMSPPNAVSDERRKEAEALFMELRNSKLPYGVCKFALENSRSDFVQFQAASTIREASMREWSILPLEEKTALRGYLVQFLTAHPRLINYVRSQLLHTVAVMVKRATLDEDQKKLFDSVLPTMSQLLATDDHKMRHLGCSLLNALLVEYSSSTGSSNIGMPLEFHSQCKKAVEEEVLLRFLLIAAQVLQRYLNADWASLSSEDHTLLSGFLNISSQILNWDFHSHLNKMASFVLVAAQKSEAAVQLKPPRTYAATFLDPNFVLLFLKLLSKVHEREDQMHHVIQCLTQLASLSKPVFETEVERQTYLINFVSGILEYVSASCSLSQQEVYGLSCILRRLATTFSAKQFSELGAERLELLVRFLAQLTCLSAQKTTLEEEEEGLTYQEALEHFLEVWVSFLCRWTIHDPSTDSVILDPTYRALLTQPLLEVFNAYVQSKISAPRGWRVARDMDPDEIVEIEEDDHVAYADELQGIGYISRTLADHTIPILINLLDQCTTECLQLLVMIKQDAQVLNSQQNNLDSLYEDLHWLTMITGYTLCQVEKGSVVEYIPSEVMQYSIAKHKATKAVEGGSSSLVPGAGGNVAAAFLQGEGGSAAVDVTSMDPIVALILSVCRLCNLERAFISNGLIDVLSPQLCETVVWCLAQVVTPYLMLDENCYQEVSLPLTSAFGRDSRSAEWLTVFLTEIATFNLSVWSSEDKLCVSSVELFNNLVRHNKPRTAIVAQCDVVWSLMRNFSSGQEPVASLPPKLQRVLMLSLLSCEAAGERQQQFIRELLQPFHDRFMLLVQRDDFRSVCQDAPIQLTILGILDALCGLVEARKSEHFQFLLPFLQVCVSLMDVYSGVAEVITVILKLFSLVAEYFVVWFESNIRNVEQQLCELSRRLIQAYAKNNIGKYSKLALVEDEQCEDLLLFVELLDHHTAILEEVGDQLITESKEQVVAVLVDGVCLLLSFVNEELLKFPTLCEKIFALFNHICIVSPTVVATLSSEAMFSFARLVELGLTNYGSEVCQYCLDSVWHLAQHYETSPHLHSLTHLSHSLQHFLKITFELILSSTFDMELLTSAAGATFTLICIMKDYYTSLVKEILGRHSGDAQAHARLLEAFQQLTVYQQDPNSYQHKLEQFLPFVKGVLYYK